MTSKTPLQNNTRVNLSDFTILANGVTSNSSADLIGHTIVGIRIPASMASTSLSFQSGESATGTFLTLKDRTNTTYTVTIGNAAMQHYLDPVVFAGVRFLKIIPGSSETNKTITLVVRPV